MKEILLFQISLIFFFNGCIRVPQQISNSPYFYSSDYSNSIELITHKISNIVINSEKQQEFCMNFKCDDDMLFWVQLRQNSEIIEHCTLVQPTDHGIRVSVNIPKNGNYELIFFGKPKTLSGDFSRILRYTINAKNLTPSEKKYPNYLGGECYIINYEVTEIGSEKPKYDYSKIDERVANTPKYVEDNMKELTEYLIKDCKNDLEKTRAIFMWIATNIEYDTESYFNGDIRKSSAVSSNVFESKKAVCSGYAGLFTKMSNYAGLKSVEISGYGKGYGYNERTQEKAKRNPESVSSNHAWNTVEIDGQWYLLDATWATGGIGNDRTFEYNFEERYFLTPPEQFIVDHYPYGENKWQLLKNPISKKQYFSRPPDEREKYLLFYSSDFRKYFKPISPTVAYNEVNLGIETIKIQVDKEFGYSIKLDKDGIQQKRPKWNYNKEINLLEIESPFKEKGDYKLIIYVNEPTSSNYISYTGVMKYYFRVEM